GLEVRQRAQAVDAGGLPEIHQHHRAAREGDGDLRALNPPAGSQLRSVERDGDGRQTRRISEGEPAGPGGRPSPAKASLEAEVDVVVVPRVVGEEDPEEGESRLAADVGEAE